MLMGALGQWAETYSKRSRRVLRRRDRRPARAKHPYHLAYGLLDHAGYLTRLGDTQAAAAAISEARDIASKLRCQPLLGWTADITPAAIPGRG